MNSLYVVENIETGDKSVTATIRLNEKHDIFSGHFPDNPVLPGVCTVQIIQELLSETSGSELHLTRAATIKYLSFINPLVNNTVMVEIKYKPSGEDHISCNARVYYDTISFCSFKGEFDIK